MPFTSSLQAGLIPTSLTGSFGVNPRWLDIDVHDSLTKGFTILFGGGGAEYLWVVYLMMAIAPVAVEALGMLKDYPKVRRGLEFVLVVLLAALLPVTYLISRKAGMNRANLDRGNGSTLPTINFTAKGGPCTGQLLFLKNGMYYIHNAQGQNKPTVQEVSIFRAEDVRDVTLIEIK